MYERALVRHCISFEGAWAPFTVIHSRQSTRVGVTKARIGHIPSCHHLSKNQFPSRTQLTVLHMGSGEMPWARPSIFARNPPLSRLRLRRRQTNFAVISVLMTFYLVLGRFEDLQQPFDVFLSIVNIFIYIYHYIRVYTNMCRWFYQFNVDSNITFFP